MDLYPSWMPFCTRSEIIGEYTSYRRLTRTLIDLILFEREALILSLADELPDGDMYLYMKSDNDTPGNPPELNPRIDLEGIVLCIV